MNERIRDLRKALGLTQQQFADKIGIRQNTVAKYETNRGVPTRAVVSLICREFRVNENWLRFGSGEMFLPKISDVDEVLEQYNLPRELRAMVFAYLQMTPEGREAVVDYVRRVALTICRWDELLDVIEEVEKPDVTEGDVQVQSGKESSSEEK